MRSTHIVQKATEIECDIDHVWHTITNFHGINHEMRPFMTMTRPPALRGKSIADATAGIYLGKSFVFLFGVLPVGLLKVRFTEIEPGKMFREESDLSGMRTWTHQRSLQAVGRHTIISDEITFAPKAPLGLIPGWGKVLSKILSAFITYRHQRLGRAKHQP